MTSARTIGYCTLGLVLAVTACAANPAAQGDVPATPTAASSAVPEPAAAGGASAGAPATDVWDTGGAAGAGGVAGASGGVTSESAPKHPSKLIMATIHGKSGSKLTGRVTLSDKGQGVKLFIEVEGAKPGMHGTHIHDYADCGTPDASSAGGHFNPHGHEHGLPEKEARHLGDLGNIVVGNDGKGTLEIVVSEANLKDSDPHSFIGRGLIIHDKKDDGGQPVGNAGARVGCAEIK